MKKGNEETYLKWVMTNGKQPSIGFFLHLGKKYSKGKPNPIIFLVLPKSIFSMLFKLSLFYLQLLTIWEFVVVNS